MPAELARAARIALLATGLALPARAQHEVRAAEPDPAEWQGRVDLQQRLGDIGVERTSAGDVLVLEAPGGPLKLTPEEFAERLYLAHRDQDRHGFLFKLFNITTLWGVLWVTLGFLGQALFTARMLMQWWESEKHKRSVVPTAFWWSSLLGGMMLLAYFVWRKDIVGVLGQSTGVVVYARNLVLIYRIQPASHASSDRTPKRAIP